MVSPARPKAPHVRRYDAESKAKFRAEIVEIARTLFAENGYDSVSMRGIAAKAGCTAMALYAYFPNKLALLRFIWADIFTDVFQAAEVAMAQRRGAARKLRAYWMSTTAYWLSHPENYRVVFLTQDTQSDSVDPGQRGMDGQFFANGALATEHLAHLGEVFGAGIASGELRQMLPELCVQIFMSQLLGMVHCVITIPEFPWSNLDELSTQACEASLRAFVISDASRRSAR